MVYAGYNYTSRTTETEGVRGHRTLNVTIRLRYIPRIIFLNQIHERRLAAGESSSLVIYEKNFL